MMYSAIFEASFWGKGFGGTCWALGRLGIILCVTPLRWSSPSHLNASK